jgi:hypothetical protein
MERKPLNDAGPLSGGDPLSSELWRIWAADIRPHFAAEADFLTKYGSQAGYESPYIARVLDDHRLLEKLVWQTGEENIAHFAQLLAAHIRYKEEYFSDRLHKVMDIRTRGLEAPVPNDP